METKKIHTKREVSKTSKCNFRYLNYKQLSNSVVNKTAKNTTLDNHFRQPEESNITLVLLGLILFFHILTVIF